jgi:hypothetical protein
LTNRIEVLADQRPVIGALAALLTLNPDLPTGHVAVYAVGGGGIGISLDSAAAFEAWRMALGFGPACVEWHLHGGSVWLEMHGEAFGARFGVTVHRMPVSFAVASVLPAEDARLQAALLVEQRHQMDDPAEPPAAYRDDALVSLPVSAWSAQVSA